MGRSQAPPTMSLSAAQPALSRSFLAILTTLIAGFGLLQFALAADEDGFWIDEIYSIQAAHLPWLDSGFDRIRRGHQPFYFWGLRIWESFIPRTWLLDNPELWYRLPQAFAWVAILGLALLSLPKRVGWKVALLTILFLALNTQLLRHALEVRMYPWLVLTQLGFLCGILDLIRRGGWTPLSHREKLSFLIWSFLGGLIVPAALVLPILLVITSLIFRGLKTAPLRARLHPKDTLPALLGTVLALLPYFLLHLFWAYRREGAMDEPITGLYTGATLLTGILLDDQGLADQFQPWLRLQLPTIFLALGILVWVAFSFRRLPRIGQMMAIILAVPAVWSLMIGLFALLGLNIPLAVPPRYFIGLIPITCLLLAIIILRQRLIPQPALIGAVVIFLAYCGNLVIDVPGHGFRDVVQRLESRLKPTDHIAVIPHDLEPVLRLYLKDVPNPIQGLWRFERNPETLRKEILALEPPEGARLIILSYRGHNSRFFRKIPAFLGPAEYPSWGDSIGSTDILILHDPEPTQAAQADPNS